MLGLACLVGGGTAAVAGNLRGNATIASRQQAQAAARVESPAAVQNQLNRQRIQITGILDQQDQERLQRGVQRNGLLGDQR